MVKYRKKRLFVERLEKVKTTRLIIHRIPTYKSNRHLKMKGDWLFPEILTNTSISGWGEASYSGNDNLCCKKMQLYFNKYFKGIVITLNTLDRIKKTVFPLVKDLIEKTALSSLIMAYEELLAKLDMKSVSHWWTESLSRQSVPIYATINRAIDERTPESFSVKALDAYKDGFRHIKCAPFDEVLSEMTSKEKQTAAQKGIERITAIIEAVPKDVSLMIDCHGRFDLNSSIWLGEILATHDLFWIEEPIPEKDSLKKLKKIKKSIPQRIAAGETLFGVKEFRRLIQSGSVDIIMPDVKHAGGFLELLEISECASQFGIETAPHNMSGPISTAATMHYGLVDSNCIFIEYPWGEMEDRHCESPENIRMGQISPSTREGWGINLKLNDIENYK
jgi:galactonate dehydratase